MRQIKDIRDEILGSIESNLNLTAPAYDRSFVRVLAVALAGESAQLELLAESQFDECDPNTALDLSRWARLVGRYRLGATACVATLRVYGNDGLQIPTGSSGITWASEMGDLYFCEVGATIAGGSADIQIKALEAGEDKNLAVGDKLVLSSPQIGIEREAEVQNIVSFAIPEESDEDWRREIIRRIANPRTAGGPADYYSVATEVGAIEDAFPYAGAVPGQIRVWLSVSDQPDGIPTAGQLQEVADAIKSAEWLPLWSQDVMPDGSPRILTLASPMIPFVATITDLSPNTPSLRDAIEKRLTQFFRSRRPFVFGLSRARENILDKNELRSMIQLSINSAGGGSFTDVQFALDSDPGTPLTKYQLPEGTRGKLDSVVFA